MARTTPVPSLALMNIMNLRELIEKCSEEAELEPNSSIVLSDIVVKGNSHHWEQSSLFIFGIHYSRYCRYKHVCIDKKYDYNHDKTTPTNGNAERVIPIDLLLTKSLFITEKSIIQLNIQKLNLPTVILCRSDILIGLNKRID